MKQDFPYGLTARANRIRVAAMVLGPVVTFIFVWLGTPLDWIPDGMMSERMEIMLDHAAVTAGPVAGIVATAGLLISPTAAGWARGLAVLFSGVYAFFLYLVSQSKLW